MCPHVRPYVGHVGTAVQVGLSVVAGNYLGGDCCGHVFAANGALHVDGAYVHCSCGSHLLLVCAVCGVACSAENAHHLVGVVPVQVDEHGERRSVIVCLGVLDDLCRA